MADELNPVEVPGEAPPVTELEPPVSTEPPVDEPPDPAALKAEIAELEVKKEAAKEAATKWRKEKAAARADFFKGRPEPAPPAITAEPSRPDPDSFDDYNNYVDALTDWKVDQKTKQWDRDQVAKTESAAHQEKMVRLQGKIDEGFAKYDDFEEVALAETVPITPMIQEILAETDNPADVAYYLGKNQTKTIAIGRMTPIAASRAIAQIEAEITTTPAPAGTNKSTTQAPPPIKPVGSSNTVTKDPEKMSQAEYNAWRDSQGATKF